MRGPHHSQGSVTYRSKHMFVQRRADGYVTAISNVNPKGEYACTPTGRIMHRISSVEANWSGWLNPEQHWGRKNRKVIPIHFRYLCGNTANRGIVCRIEQIPRDVPLCGKCEQIAMRKDMSPSPLSTVFIPRAGNWRKDYPTFRERGLL